MSAKTELSRRKFLTTAAAAVSGAATAESAFMIVPRHVLGRGFTPPSDKLNIAGVGVGGIGRANLINLASQNIVALCDVDWDYAGKAFEHLDVDIQALQTRLDQADPQPDLSEFCERSQKSCLTHSSSGGLDTPEAG